ncbi:3666_t:CDS:2 [Funneliformis geosporum]|uniref:3666_t:CDS:1 n=1 Tax=Funneliformis geosporum TaxID=1117311 RepID=A0A9W4X172_9GLOM|nr:3666_t:CDS:2 [Funneliformis geosporum]
MSEMTEFDHSDLIRRNEFQRVKYQENLKTCCADGILREKITKLYGITTDLTTLRELGYCHKDFHSGNILQDERDSYVSDFIILMTNLLNASLKLKPNNDITLMKQCFDPNPSKRPTVLQLIDTLEIWNQAYSD